MASTATGRQARLGAGVRFDQRGGDSFAWTQRVDDTGERFVDRHGPRPLYRRLIELRHRVAAHVLTPEGG